MGHNLVAAPAGGWTWRYDPNVHAQRVILIPEAEGWSALARVRCSTLILRGEGSDLLGRGVAGRMARDMTKAAFFEVPGSGHLVPLDEPEAFHGALRQFLAS